MEEKGRENSGVENGEANLEGENKEVGREHPGLQEDGTEEEEEEEEEEAVKTQQLITGVGQKKVKAKEEKEASAITADNRGT